MFGCRRLLHSKRSCELLDRLISTAKRLDHAHTGRLGQRVRAVCDEAHMLTRETPHRVLGAHAHIGILLMSLCVWNPLCYLPHDRPTSTRA